MLAQLFNIIIQAFRRPRFSNKILRLFVPLCVVRKGECFTGLGEVYINGITVGKVKECDFGEVSQRF